MNALSLVDKYQFVRVKFSTAISSLQLCSFPGAFAAFSAGEGVHFKLERTSCQQSLKYLSLYNTEGAPFSTALILMYTL